MLIDQHPTVYVGRDSVIGRLILNDITTQNATGLPMPLLLNKGKIEYLSLRRADAAGDPVIVNEGEIIEKED